MPHTCMNHGAAPCRPRAANGVHGPNPSIPMCPGKAWQTHRHPLWRQAQQQGTAMSHSVHLILHAAPRALRRAAAGASQQPAVTCRAVASAASISAFADGAAAGQRLRRAASSSCLGLLLAPGASGVLRPQDLRRQCMSMSVWRQRLCSRGVSKPRTPAVSDNAHHGTAGRRHHTYTIAAQGHHRSQPPT